MRFKLTFPERIGSRRRELGMTRYDLARISRVSYSKLTDLERSRYKRVDALVLEAVAMALRIHPLELSAEYEPPANPAITHVAVDGRRIADYLEGEGISALELSKRAGVKHEYVYNVARYDQQTLPADVARKLAKAMGLRRVMSLPRYWPSTLDPAAKPCTAML